MATEIRSLLIGVLLLAVLGCGDATPPVLPGDLNLEVTGGGEQTGLVGQELPNPIVVKVTGPDGPAPGVLINFVVTAGGGHVFAGSALTNTAGEARERWTLGPAAGDNVIEARSVDQTTGDAIVYAQIHATGVTSPPGEPALHYIAPEYRSQYRVAGQTIDARDFVFVYDGNGTPIPNPPLTLTAESGFLISGTTVRADPAAGEVNGIVHVALAGISDSFALGFLPDLTGLRWRASYSCRAGSVHFDIDSIIDVVALSDSVRQETEELFVQLYSGMDAIIYMQASGKVYYRDGRVTNGPLPDHVARNITARLFPHRIDYGRLIQWWRPGWSPGAMTYSSAASDGSLPPIYHGGDMCDDAFEDYSPGLLEPVH
jgi:hypothetical protein